MEVLKHCISFLNQPVFTASGFKWNLSLLYGIGSDKRSTKQLRTNEHCGSNVGAQEISDTVAFTGQRHL